MKKFRLHPAITRVTTHGGEIVLDGAPDIVKLADPEGRLLPLVTSLEGFDAQNLSGIATSVEEENELAAMLSVLIERGLIIEVADSAEPSDEYARGLDLIASATRNHYRSFALPTGRSALDEFSVFVVGHGRIVAALGDLLRDSGVTNVTTGAEVPTGIYSICVVCDAGTASKDTLRRMNAEVVRFEHNALYVDISVPIISIGPFYVPKSSGCYECFLTRLRSNLSSSVGCDNNRPWTRAPVDAGRIPTEIGASLAANVIVQLAHGLRHLAPAGSLLEYDVTTHAASLTHLVRAPRCAICASNMANYTGTTHFRVMPSASSASAPSTT